MKTKIIYISGSEIFDMRDIQSAFDQVRTMLCLDKDTVLFGVPVDNADSLGNTVASSDVSQNMTDSDIAPTTVQQTDILQEELPDDQNTVTVSESISNISAVPDMSVVASQTADLEVMPEIVKKSRGRSKSVKTESLKADNPEKSADLKNKVVSILSVLTPKQSDADLDAKDTVSDTAEMAEVYDDIDIVDVSDDTTELCAETVTSDAPDTLSTDECLVDAGAETVVSVSVQDMISDEEPTIPAERTLEQLLESMTPLREDIEHEQQNPVSVEVPDINCMNDADTSDGLDSESDPIADDTDIDTDATLEKLATEFAETENTILPAKKTLGQGKIGKLKNILPFKKVKHDDTSLMGDLFGWAGVAANDDDFTMPGFFTNTASKK